MLEPVKVRRTGSRKVFTGIFWAGFTGGGLWAQYPPQYIQTKSSAAVRLDMDRKRRSASSWTSRKWVTGSLNQFYFTSFPPSRHLFISSSIYPLCLTEGMYFGRDPRWCDGHASPVWNGNLHILHRQGDPGISLKTQWKEMEQVKKNSHLYWGFPFKNTSKYRNDTSCSGCDAL